MIKDPYFYPNTNVHINVAGIMDKQALKTYTANQFGLAMLKLQKQDFIINSSRDFLVLHKILFGNVFTWAGQIRTVNMQTSEFIIAGGMVEFADFKTIDEQFYQLDQKYMSLKWNLFPRKEFIDKLAQFMVDVWVLHPLREGNTRTLIIFLDLFSKKYGYEIDINKFNQSKEEIRNTFVWGAIGELLSIKEILNKILIYKR